MFVSKVQCRCTFGAKSTRSGERLFTWSSVELHAKFICQDIRTITFDEEFDVVLNMADGAIGYLEDDGENHKIFSVIAKA